MFSLFVASFYCLFTLDVTRGCPHGRKLEQEPLEPLHYGETAFGVPDEKTGAKVGDWSPSSSKVNPEELGEYLEGDILFPNRAKNGLLAFSAKWDGGIVPYVISGPYNDNELKVIHEAIKKYHDNTCIRYKKK